MRDLKGEDYKMNDTSKSNLIKSHLWMVCRGLLLPVLFLCIGWLEDVKSVIVVWVSVYVIQLIRWLWKRFGGGRNHKKRQMWIGRKGVF